MPCLVSVLVLDSAECELAGTAKLSPGLFFSLFQTLNTVVLQVNSCLEKYLGSQDKKMVFTYFAPVYIVRATY